MTAKTEPLAAPAGTKWVVSKSMIGDPYQLGLFPEDADVDMLGVYYRKFGPNANFPNGGSTPRYALARETFASESQIRRASRRVLRRYALERGEHDLFARLREAFS